ncbi:hypothetical protein BaRGS_00000363 [Batillaria attramentaria]|uniref:Uncharacterized protein n=1 Tax=Batillaria attramentaria TaxID=370345 RepID=A0ABD0M8F5_9CAEN
MYVCWYNYGGQPAVALPQAPAHIPTPTPISAPPAPTVTVPHAPAEYLIPVSPQTQTILTTVGIPRKARESVVICIVLPQLWAPCGPGRLGIDESGLMSMLDGGCRCYSSCIVPMVSGIGAGTEFHLADSCFAKVFLSTGATVVVTGTAHGEEKKEKKVVGHSRGSSLP